MSFYCDQPDQCHSHDHHTQGELLTDHRRIALVGSPNSGKTTLFNALTGMRAKTGNYPGVTVARYEGLARAGNADVVIEDLPGTYSLDPISPDEAIVDAVLDVDNHAFRTPDAIIITLDATTLRRSLNVAVQTLNLPQPALVVVTFMDEHTRRSGTLDLAALEKALGVPVLGISAGDPSGVAQLREAMTDPESWSRPIVPPPTEAEESQAWLMSVLDRAGYTNPKPDSRTLKVDRVLLHPVWGSVIFFTVMFAFFQVLFTAAAPLMEGIETFFGWLAGLTVEHVPGVPGRFLSEAVIGGVGGVLVFLPQILLLFLMISLLEATGYMSRAAFLMDKVMGRFGLEGRAFVAMLSSLACAIPGIMATRSLPSARDRIATMMGAPLMTCSARLPVYVMLIAMLVPNTTIGIFGLQGLIMFALYLGGAIAAMLTAAFFGWVAGRGSTRLPFYMEMPPYRMPSAKAVLLSMWDAAKAFLQKVTSIILITTALLWGALNLPVANEAAMVKAGVDITQEAEVARYTIDNSVAATIGKAVEPVFEPLGFDWRINVGVLASLSAREIFVATMGQIAAAEDPEDPSTALEEMTWTSGPKQGELLFTPGTIAALMVFFMFALQCFATMGVMRRETGGWKWPLIAFGYMFALAWGLGWVAQVGVTALVG